MPFAVAIAAGGQVESLAMAAPNFPVADFGPEVSHASSSTGVFLNAASACFAWHLTTAATSFPTALAIPSSHLPASFDWGTQPVNDQAAGADRKTPTRTHRHHRIVPPRALRRSVLVPKFRALHDGRVSAAVTWARRYDTRAAGRRRTPRRDCSRSVG